MISVRSLNPPEYTQEKQQVLIDSVLALRKTSIQQLFHESDLPTSGTKPELRERLQEALNEGRVTSQTVVNFLDSFAPWGKQHVFLYDGPTSEDLDFWRESLQVKDLLEQHGLGHLSNARQPMVLPDDLELSSIIHDERVLRITAIQSRPYSERDPGLDQEKQTSNGSVTLKAYQQRVTRSFVAFEWSLVSNTAMLQIAQLPSDVMYEELAGDFFALVGGWLKSSHFNQVDVRHAIRSLHESEGSDHPEARSHGIQYRTLQGRQLSARSACASDSVLGEPGIDHALNSVKESGVGHMGNFYWLADAQPGPLPNPLQSDVHVKIVGDKFRINFPTPNSEIAVRYVLSRVRSLSRPAS